MFPTTELNPIKHIEALLDPTFLSWLFKTNYFVLWSMCPNYTEPTFYSKHFVTTELVL